MPYADPLKQKEYQRRWVAERRRKFMEGKSCAECGSTDNLNLHHRIPSDKTAHRIWSWSWARIHAEAEKCDILCSECHKAKHEAKHGSISMYRKGCRCSFCRNANTLSRRPFLPV